MTREEIEKKLGKITELPTLPTIVTQILEVSRNPRSNASDMGNLIAQDQALTTKTLRLVNSAFYGFPKKINSITRAIVILGFDKVKNITLAASVFGALRVEAGGATFDLGRFWEHALGVGIAAEVLAVRNGSAYKNDAFVAGLLHDIGKIAIIRYFDDAFAQISNRIEESGALWADAERDILEGGHSHIGGWLAEKWNFPPVLVMPIRFHHDPEADRTHRELTYLVHTADIFVRALDIGHPGDEAIPRISTNVWESAGMDEGDLEEVFSEILDKMEKAEAFMDLARG